MPKYAMVNNGTVTDIVDLPNGAADLRERYHASLHSNFFALSEQEARIVSVGWQHGAAGFVMSPPDSVPVPQLIIPEPPQHPERGRHYVSALEVIRQVATFGKYKEFAAELMKDPELFVFLSLAGGTFRSDDDKVHTLLRTIGLDHNEILKKENE